jgi:hypothetical protein
VIARALVLLAAPATAVFGGLWLLASFAGTGLSRPTPYGLRGYDAARLVELWTPDAAAETRFLYGDLAFAPYFVAVAFAAILYALDTLGLRAWWPWALALAIVTLAADWTENAMLLGQIEVFNAAKRLDPNGVPPLDATRVAIASVATQIKLVGVYAILGAYAALCAATIVKAVRAALG